MGCVAEVAELRTSPRHRPVGPALRCVGLWALSRPSAHIRACCRACGTSPGQRRMREGISVGEGFGVQQSGVGKSYMLKKKTKKNNTLPC